MTTHLHIIYFKVSKQIPSAANIYLLPGCRLDKKLIGTAYGTVWLGTGVNYTNRASGKEKAAKLESSSRDQLLVLNLSSHVYCSHYLFSPSAARPDPLHLPSAPPPQLITSVLPILCARSYYGSYTKAIPPRDRQTRRQGALQPQREQECRYSGKLRP